MTEKLTEICTCPKNIPPELWEKMLKDTPRSEGVEALRPLLRIIARQLFAQISGEKENILDAEKQILTLKF
jgi:hypothetical protein